MNEERRKYLLKYIREGFHKYSKETLLNAFLKAGESEETFNLLYSEVKGELKPKMPVIEEPLIPQQQEKKRINDLVAVRLTDELLEKIGNSNKSAIIRKALEFYFENKENNE